MVTIADTDDLKFTTVMSLAQQLVLMGLNDAQLARALQKPGCLREAADVLMASPPKLPRRLVGERRRELISNLFPAKFDEKDGESRATVQYALFSDERKWLEQDEQVLYLLGLLTRQQLVVMLERAGLDGRSAMSAEELSDKLCVSVTQINRIRGRARHIMIDEATQLIEKSRIVHRFSLPSNS